MFEQLKSDLKHLSQSLKRIYKGWKSGKDIFVSDYEIRYRRFLCNKCPNKTKRNYFFKKKDACSLCGCFIKEKTKFKEEMCPDWPPKW